MTRVAWISPSPFLPTGLGRVSRYLTRGLRDAGFDVRLGNLQHYGQPVEVDGIVHYSLAEPEFVVRFLDEVRPDLVVAYGSIWVPPFNVLGELCARRGLKLMLYVTIEFSSLSYHFLRPLIGASYIITPSEFGRRVLTKYNISEDRVGVVPHGVDTRVFRPLGCRFEGYEDAFVYGMVARNSVRKEFGSLIRAFAMLPPEVREESVLYLHTAPTELGTSLHGPTKGWDIPLLVVKYGLQGKVLMPPDNHKYWGATDEELAKVYSALDVYVQATSGEGFGLPVLEAMACGRPVIASNNTAMPEVVGDAGLLVPCWEEDLETTDGFTVATTKVGELSKAMARLFHDEGLRRELSRRALERAQLFTWERAVSLLVEAVEEALRREDRVGPEVLRAREPILADTDPRRFVKYCPRGSGVAIDVGSGRRCLARPHLQALGYDEYVAVDLRPSRRVTVVADARRLPFRDGCADLLWMNQVLEHIPTEDQPRAVEEARRVGRRGIIVFPSEQAHCYWADPDHKPLSGEVKGAAQLIEEGDYYMVRW